MRPPALWPLALLALLLTDAGQAQTVVTSPAPAATAITIYRAPERLGEAIQLYNLQGFALVTETREVDLPAGPAVIRFEGVAGNILPESAVVGGVPAGVREKNLDADLLSPRTLYDRMLGRRVLVRRTNPKTGRVTTEQALIRSSAEGAAVLQLAGGFEALRCSGLPEAVVYPEVPAGLSPKPTLSIRTDAPRPVRARLTLSYLAGGFDWQADYTLLLTPEGRADLFAFVTVASSDVTSFPGTAAAVVAGKLNRVERTADPLDREDGELALRCWPTKPSFAQAASAPPAPPPPMVMAAPVAAMDIVVTGSRMAKREELGDVKLYRFPERVTVASQAQKQITLLHQPAVATRLVYRQRVREDQADDVKLLVRMKNRTADGLGLPLPTGPVHVFAPAGDTRILLGERTLADKAVGEDIELALEAGPGVQGEVETLDKHRYRLVVTNANPAPVAYEARLAVDDGERLRAGGLGTDKDASVWAVTIPANGTRTLKYRVEKAR